MEIKFIERKSFYFRIDTLKLIIFHEREKEKKRLDILKGNRSSPTPQNFSIYQVLTYKRRYYKDLVKSSKIFRLAEINYASELFADLIPK